MSRNLPACTRSSVRLEVAGRAYAHALCLSLSIAWLGSTAAEADWSETLGWWRGREWWVGGDTISGGGALVSGAGASASRAVWVSSEVIVAFGRIPGNLLLTCAEAIPPRASNIATTPATEK